MCASVKLRHPRIVPLFHLVMELVHIKRRMHDSLLFSLRFYRPIVFLHFLRLIQRHAKPDEPTGVFFVGGSLEGRFVSSLSKGSGVAFEGH